MQGVWRYWRTVRSWRSPAAKARVEVRMQGAMTRERPDRRPPRACSARHELVRASSHEPLSHRNIHEARASRRGLGQERLESQQLRHRRRHLWVLVAEPLLLEPLHLLALRRHRRLHLLYFLGRQLDSGRALGRGGGGRRRRLRLVGRLVPRDDDPRLGELWSGSGLESG